MLKSVTAFILGLLGSKVPSFVTTLVSDVAGNIDPIINAELEKVNVDPTKAEAVVTAVLDLVNNVKDAVSAHVATATAVTANAAAPSVTTKAV